MVIHAHFAQLNYDLHVLDIVQPYCYIYRHCVCALFNLSFICMLLMFIDLFIDWGNPSNNLSDYIKTFGESQLPVDSRIFLVNLVTGLKFKLVL